LQVELPDAALQASVDAARATVLLGVVGGGDRVVRQSAAAWGLAEVGSRRTPAENVDDPWLEVKATLAGATATPRRAAEWLRAVRALLVAVNDDRVAVLPDFPLEWLGQPVTVNDVPTRHGPVSFALRWHGTRPALLWDVPAGLRVHAPILDPAWEAIGNAGEALLAEIDPTRLLSLGSPPTPDSESRPGVIVDEPGSFV
jgi:hypothetical protein